MISTTVLAVRRETHDTVTLRIAAPLQFTPGQFAMIGLHVGGKPIRRSYSIASAPNGAYVELAVKKQEHGLFSKYAQTMESGEQVTLHGPFGNHFLFEPSTADAQRTMVFIAGGSGIAPFRSMLHAAAAAGYAGKMVLLYSVRTRQDIIFEEELSKLADQLNLSVKITLSRPDENDGEWSGLTGRLSPEMLAEQLGSADIHEHLYYICGPTPLVQGVQTALSVLGVPKERMKTEKFGQIET